MFRFFFSITFTAIYSFILYERIAKLKKNKLPSFAKFFNFDNFFAFTFSQSVEFQQMNLIDENKKYK